MTQPTPPPRPRRRWVPWMWAGVVVVVLVPLLAVGGIWFAVQGGWDGIRPRAEATDDDVVAARTAASPQQEARAADLAEAAAGTTGADVLASGTQDACDEGWNNWKVRDDFTLRCTLTTAAVLGLEPGADLDSVARELDAALVDAGWTPESGTGLVDPDQAYPNGRYAADDDPDLTVVVDVRSNYESSSLGLGGGREVWSSGSLDDVVAAGVAHDGPVVELSVETRYFEDD